MRIGSKISAGFAAMVVLTGVLGLAGWLGLDRYAGSVDGADRMAAIAERVGSANSDAVTFRATRDESAVVRAGSSLHEARQAAEEIGVVKLSDAIGRFEGAFSELVRLANEAEGLTADMEFSAINLEQFASSIREAEQNRYGAVAQARTEAATLQNDRLAGAQAAEALIRAMLTARREEALFRMTNEKQQADQTRTAIKGMFLAALKLKKAAGDGEDGALAGKVATGASGYRQAFEALTEAAPKTAEADKAAADLDSVSEDIGQAATEVSRLQIDSYNKARARADAAADSLEKAAATSALALEMVADVRALSLAEIKTVQSRGEADARVQVNAALDALDSDIDRLTAIATGEETQDTLNLAKDEIAAYRKSFDAMIGAITLEAKAAATVTDAAQEVGTVVGHEVATFAASRDADGLLARIVIGTGAASAALLAILIAFALVRSIVRPIRSMTDVMERLAADDVDVEVPGIDRSDEIADMARTVQVFKDNAQRMRRLETEKEETDRHTAEEKRRVMEELASSFEQSVGSVVQGLTGFINDVRGRAESMSEASEVARQQAIGVASSSEEASTNVQAVSAAAEELAASVNEIGSQVGRAAQMAKRASEEAQRGDTRVQALAETATRIGDVITLIQDIAEQTNLLALNATIEAARAGDAGKGFAVVASEVKSLAGQTAKATDEIRSQIEDIQSSSRDAVIAIQAISEAVNELDTMNGAVAAAVEEQSATTNEIARNTQEAAAGSSQVSGAIVEVSSASERTGESASAVLAMCGELSSVASTLDKEVHDFLARIRAS
jgi:methyl-accepting chemotaxis protein